MLRGPRGPCPGPRVLSIGQPHSAAWPSSNPVDSSEAAGVAGVNLTAPPDVPSCAGIATFSTFGAVSAAATTLAWGGRTPGPGLTVAGRRAATAGLAAGTVLGPPAELFVIEAEDMGAGMALVRRSGGTSEPATVSGAIPPPRFAAAGRLESADAAVLAWRALACLACASVIPMVPAIFVQLMPPARICSKPG